jgi:LAS superfamily LD-carboxypeptidase LdcB
MFVSIRFILVSMFVTICKIIFNKLTLKKVENQTKLNTRNLIQQDTRIKKLEEQPRVQTVVQPVVVSEEIESLKSKVLDLQCRSMKNNLVYRDDI